MKQVAAVFLTAVLLTGCSKSVSEVDRGLALRSKLLEGESCSFDADITADYGDKLYTFCMQCQSDKDGAMSFTVVKPQSIAGVSGKITQGKGNLTFDASALAFPLLADEQITPVSAPWIFLQTLRTGYLTSAGKEGDALRLSIDDSYADNPLHLEIWLTGEDVPTRAEIRYKDRKILSLDVENFQIQ